MAADETHITLSLLDYIPPSNYVRVIFPYPLKPGVDEQVVFDDLHEALHKTFAQVPWVSGKVFAQPRDAPGWRPGQLEIRHRPYSLNGPRPYQLRYHKLDTDWTYDEFKKNGFPSGVFPEELLLLDAPLIGDPHSPTGADVFLGQASFLPGGMLLGMTTCHAATDAGGVVNITKLWAENFRELRGRDAGGKLAPSPFADLDNDRTLAEKLWKRETEGRSSSRTADDPWLRTLVCLDVERSGDDLSYEGQKQGTEGKKSAKPNTFNCRAVNGHTVNGHAVNGYAVNGHATNGHDANGHAANGHAANGHVANGHVANGHVANGHVANGHVANGHVANGHVANGHVANGHAANGDAANGDTINEHTANGDTINGHAANGATNGHATNGAINGHAANGYTANGLINGQPVSKHTVNGTSASGLRANNDPLPPGYPRIMLNRIMFISGVDLAALHKECNREPLPPGASPLSVSDAINALFWRGVMRARAAAATARSCSLDEISVFESPVDVRDAMGPEFPTSYLGNCFLMNSARMPLAELISPSTPLGRVAQALRRGAADVNMRAIYDGYTLLKSTPDLSCVQGRFVERHESADLLLSNIITFPITVLDFGDQYFENDGKPHGLRILHGQYAPYVRLGHVLPRNPKHGGVELSLNLFDDEMTYLDADAEFARYLVPIEPHR